MASTGRSSKPKNLVMDPMVFFGEFLARGKRVCSLHINLDGQIGVSCLDAGGCTGPMTAVTPKPTFVMMTEELHKFMVQKSAEACVVGLVTEKHVSQYVERFAKRLFETGKLQDVKYVLFEIDMSYDSLMATSSGMLGFHSSDPSSGRKRLGQLKNWRVPPFFDDEIVAMSKPIFTLCIALDGGIRVAGSGLESVVGIPPKATFDLMAEELDRLISRHAIEGCIIAVPSENSEFDDLFSHRLFQTGKLKEVKYTFHPIVKNSPKD